MQIEKDRNYIHHLEEKGEGKINWNVWDKIVEETRNLIITTKFTNKEKIYRARRLVVYAYDSNGDLVRKFNSNRECAQYVNTNDCTIHRYSINNYICNNLLLTRELLTKDVAFAMYRFALEHGKVYRSSITKTKPTKTVYTYRDDGKMIGVFESLNKYCKCIGSNNLTRLRKQLLNGDIITNGKLLSFSFYDETTAKEIYTALKSNK